LKVRSLPYSKKRNRAAFINQLCLKEGQGPAKQRPDEFSVKLFRTDSEYKRRKMYRYQKHADEHDG